MLVSTFWTTALISEVSISWVRAECEIWLASHGSKIASQSPFSMPFVGAYMHTLKTTRYIWTFCVLNNCSAIADIIFVVLWSSMRYSIGELWPQVCISHSLTQHCHAHTASPYIHRYLVCNFTWQQNSHSLWLYYTPNDGFTAKDASF